MSVTEQTHKILVAEDNDFVRMQIVKYLSDAGYEVEEATTGDDAVAFIDNGVKYDLTIVDVRMEPMGGFEFIKHMRSNEINTPAILVTGDQDPNLLTEASRWGVAAVLIKPVQKERLIKTVEKTMRTERRRG